MAVVATKNPTGLKLKLSAGKDPETDKMIVKSRTYGNVKPSASNDDMYEVGELIFGLMDSMKLSLLEISRIDNTTLSA
ncbi:DUF1659 domain-containing protein [Romboutsia lituseburensis]|uniref:DUF1659 domain-containing protein n=1 Tax=Romboutsia lituseburensis TaxID=1537 RepID=UPI0022EAD1DF|nr:DUF1659 domain-containing protein [Romboutsia lituseburensis]